MASLSGEFNFYATTDAGAPLASGRVYTYTAGTTTKKTAYTDAAGSVAHTYVSDGAGGEYIALNSRGELPSPLFLASGSYDITLKTSVGVTVWTRRAKGVSDAGRVSIADYGASPSASASVNATAIAAAHAAALLVDYPPGTYDYPGGVSLRSGTRIFASGATLRADASFGASTTWFANQNMGAFTDTDIQIHGLTFDGNGIGQGGASLTRTVGMVRFVKVTGVVFRDCKFMDCGYTGLTLRSCRNVVVSGCEFTGLGWDGLTDSDGGSAIWCASTAAGEDPQDIQIVNNNFHDNYWSGIQLNGVGCVVKGNIFRNEYETHIYSPHDAENATYVARNHVIVGNLFDGSVLSVVSGNGIETCAHDGVIADNTILNCDEAGIQVFGSQNLVISGNTIGRCGKLTSATARAGVLLISNDGALGTPGDSPTFRDRCENVQVINNRFYDNQGTPTMKYGVLATSAYNTKAAAYCVIAGNDFTNVSWASSGAALSLPTADWDASNCTVGDSQGAASRAWTPVVTSGSGTVTTYSTSQTSFQKVGNLVHFTATVTITDNGTGASNLKTTLPPFVPAIPFVCSAWNTTQSRGVMGVWSSGTTITFLRPDTGAYPVATGDTLRITGSYLSA